MCIVSGSSPIWAKDSVTFLGATSLLIIFYFIAEEQFVNLCFEFGIELEEVTTNALISRKEKEELSKVNVNI
jgi:hypothetical protein